MRAPGTPRVGGTGGGGRVLDLMGGGGGGLLPVGIGGEGGAADGSGGSGEASFSADSCSACASLSWVDSVGLDSSSVDGVLDSATFGDDCSSTEGTSNALSDSVFG